MFVRGALAVAVVSACAKAPDTPITRELVTVDRASGRTATTADAPLQYALEFGSSDVRMPQALFLDGIDRIGSADDCFDSGVGIHLYPAMKAIAPLQGGTSASGGLAVKRAGPIVAEVEVTWMQTYTCGAAQTATGTSTFTMFPNGRIVRHDIAKPSDALLNTPGSCSPCNDNKFFFTSMWSFALGAQAVKRDGMPAVSEELGIDAACAVYPNHTIGIAWSGTNNRYTLHPTLLAFTHDWVNQELTVEPTQVEHVSALMLSERTTVDACDDVLADLDDFPIAIDGVQVFSDDGGIYVDERAHTLPVEIKPPRALPKGFAIALDVGDFAEVTREPELDRDWFFVQADGTRTIFWFPDGLGVGETITIDPR